MSDATQKCPVCSAELPGRARFCAECGTSLKAAPGPLAAAAPRAAAAAAGNPVMPWFIAGVFVLAIHATVIILAVRRPEPAPGNQSSSAAPFAQGGSRTTSGTTDISNMTPREAADRLFDRIARASESGDTGQVAFFAPMALQAYAQVTPLDPDARLHIGMIDLATGNAAGAAAQGDSITRAARTHLFGPLLKARAAEARGDNAALRQAWQTLLANWTAERAKNLPEYDQHDAVLTEARTAAQRTGSR